MSILLTDITLALNTKVQLSTEGYSFQEIDWIELTNHSPWACHVATGGNTLLLPAWYTYPIPLKDNQGRVLPGLALPFTVTPYLQTIPGTGSVNTLNTVLYTAGETPKNTLPVPLGGGPIDLTIASQIISTNQPSGNSIVFGAPNGDGSATGATNIKNNGQILLGDTSNIGKLTINHETGGTIDFTSIGNGQSFSLADSAFQLINLLMGATDPSITLENTGGTSSVVINTTSPNIDLSAATGAIGLLTKGAINSSIAAFSTINGSVSGTCTMWMPFQGSALKLVILYMNNYQDGSNRSVAFPVAFVNDVGFMILGDLGVSGNGGFNLQVGAAAQNLDIWTGLALAGGAAGTQTGLYKHSIGHVNNNITTNPIDHIQINLNTAAHQGIAIFIGN